MKETDGKNISTSFTYDDEGRMTSCDIENGKEEDPIDLTVNYSQDEEGKETAIIIDANGNIKKEVTTL